MWRYCYSTGNEISKDDFLVNDQGIKINFFSGVLKLNLDDNPVLDILVAHAFRPPKNRAVFELQKDYGNVFGNQFAGARSINLDMLVVWKEEMNYL